MAYRIESSRRPQTDWHVVGPRPQSEPHPFDDKGLLFATFEDAAKAQTSLVVANPGAFRIVAA